MLVEICCKCGFVHKDARILIGDQPFRAYKPHYHWTPMDGELIQGSVVLHATLCAACCEGQMNWKEFFEQKRLTPAKYYVKGSLNAPLPDRFLDMATALYTEQIKYFQFD